MKIDVKRFDKNLPLPDGEEGAACLDLACSETVTFPPGKIRSIRLNIALKVPSGYALLLFNRSSTPHKKGLILANGVGVVDPFYCGDGDENMAFLLNITDEPVTVSKGDKIVQCMIIKTEKIEWHEVDSMNSSGHGGYRHSDSLNV